MHHPLVVRAGKHDICTYKVGQILLAWGVPQDPLFVRQGGRMTSSCKVRPWCERIPRAGFSSSRLARLRAGRRCE